jgi:cell wall-associated NlpC family hydrolase
VRASPFRAGAPLKSQGAGSENGEVTPRPLLRRLICVVALFGILIALLALPAVAGGGAPGGVDVNAGDPATDPSVADTTAPPAGSRTSSTTSWSDVPSGYWDKSAINFVAGTNTWMRDFGTNTFKPEILESRRLFAKAVVTAFAPNDQPDPNVEFSDVDASDPYLPEMNVAVKNGWMLPTGDKFRPNDPVGLIQVHRALVWALGLSNVVAGANQMHTSNGYTFQHNATFGTRLVGAVLGLRYNHSDESMDVGPGDMLDRAEVAWSLYRAYVINTSETWRKSQVQIYATIHLGPTPVAFRQVVEFGMRYVGFPYVYAGEWNTESPPGYCCGYQPRGGFDCSGLMWWVLRQGDSLYDNTKLRGYAGYVLNQRSSNDMAKAIPASQRIAWSDTKAGNLMFYDSNHDGTIDHVDLNLGGGWALDSGSNGVTIVRLPGSWYEDTFAWGRKLVPAS